MHSFITGKQTYSAPTCARGGNLHITYATAGATKFFSSGDGMSASLQQKRKYFCKASQPCIHPPTVFRSGLERNPCNVAWLAKTWRFPMNSSFVEKEPVVVFVWYILTSNQHWDRFLVIIGKTQNVKVSRYLYHTSHRLNFSLF